MTYNLLTDRLLPHETVVQALAKCLGVNENAVDVGDDTIDPALRNWDAQVLCEATLTEGDVSMSLDIDVQESVASHPAEAVLARAFAQATDTLVLFPAEEAPPSAYWLADAEGTLTRARLEPSDDEIPVYAITAVESPVTRLPRTPVTRFEEIVREQSATQVAAPLADRFAEHLRALHPEAPDAAGSPSWYARTRLAAWEKFVRQMADAWAPSGWYPPDFYRERLESRDTLEELVHQEPQDASDLLRLALTPLDQRFQELTIEDPTNALASELLGSTQAAEARGWWWKRRPDPLPW
ncbi:hypothetical protein [Streptomyces beihaiensis]|uniref:Uncharacterized protein n=1 Tax=Streptomyces beihaiensis TaxID=2984495 RepID=A0ABT3TPX8_9ACTN|nr:hypothetical protein [Streptomyces beihaiensis]MCX3059089.1 hypothetical protein [Streptomyces beihaiensis]